MTESKGEIRGTSSSYTRRGNVSSLAVVAITALVLTFFLSYDVAHQLMVRVMELNPFVAIRLPIPFELFYNRIIPISFSVVFASLVTISLCRNIKFISRTIKEYLVNACAEFDPHGAAKRYLETLSASEPSVAQRALIIEEIRNRVAGISYRAEVILASIGAIIVAAVLIVIFAGQLTLLDATAIGPADRLKTELSGLDNQIAAISDARSRLQRIEALRKINNPSERDEKERIDIERYINDRAYQFNAPKDLKSLEDSYQNLIARREYLSQSLQKAWDKEVASDRGYSDTKYIIATAITRIGVVLILVFMVQILLGFYRYNTRLATFYSSYADIISLWNGKLDDLDRLFVNFSAPKVDFGKDPRHPLEDILKVLRDRIATDRDPANMK